MIGGNENKNLNIHNHKRDQIYEADSGVAFKENATEGAISNKFQNFIATKDNKT